MNYAKNQTITSLNDDVISQLYFSTRAILIDNHIEPSERNMAKAFGLSRTTFRRKIDSKFVKISGHALSPQMPTHTGSDQVCTTYRGTYLPCRSGSLINYLAINGLPFAGLILNKDNIDDYLLDESDVMDAMTVALYRSLRKNGHFHALTSYKNGIAYANAVNHLFHTMAMSSYRVHHDNKHLKYLLRHDRTYSFTALFERKGAYVVGLKSSKTWFTQYSEEVILPDAMDFFFGLKFKSCHVAPTDLVLTEADLRAVPVKRDLYILLSNLKGMSGGSYVINRRVKDVQHSRVYSVATSLSAETRIALGYNNYDMDAALQSIVFNFIDVDAYPDLNHLITDKK
jgi:hypothetical protein